jgi:hypothetical protein
MPKIIIVTAETTTQTDSNNKLIETVVKTIMDTQVNSAHDGVNASSLTLEELLCRNLRDLAEKIGRRSGKIKNDDDAWSVRKYGANFKNDIFEMHPYYWGDCTCEQKQRETTFLAEHVHAKACYYQKNIRHMVPNELLAYCDCPVADLYAGWYDADAGHSDACRLSLPNFRCGDVVVNWYKYIGRDNTLNRPITRPELDTMFKHCFLSFRPS